MDPMTIGMLVGAGSSLLSGFMQSRANKRALKSAGQFTPERVSTQGYQDLYDKVSGANFDQPLYEGFQSSQRGAAMQNQRMYAQMGNPNLAAEATAMDRRSAQGSLFGALGQNNMQRFDMLSQIQGGISGIESQNVQASNAAKMSMLNMRSQMQQNSPWAQATSAIGGMAMGYGAQVSGQRAMQDNNMFNQRMFQSMFGRGQAGNQPQTMQFINQQRQLGGGLNMGLVPRPNTNPFG